VWFSAENLKTEDQKMQNAAPQGSLGPSLTDISDFKIQTSDTSEEKRKSESKQLKLPQIP
jgi:hypothetical protein